MSDYPDQPMCPNCVTPWKCNGPHIPENSELAALRTKLEEQERQLRSANKDFEEMRRLFNQAAAIARQLVERAEEAERKLADKDRDRQYHMDAINRLASFLALTGTSFEVVQAAIDNMTRMANELSVIRAKMKEIE